MSNADAFMFKLFSLYSKALKTDQRNSYFVLSSGTNEFPAPRMYKRLWQTELQEDLFYRFYTLEEGYPAVVGCLKLYENMVATGQPAGRQPFEHLCVTAGASGAVSGVFQWLRSQRSLCRVLLLGLNYSLFARCAAQFAWPVTDLLSENPGRILPTVEEIEAYGERHPVDLLVVTLPANPSGELYSEDELRRLLHWAREHQAHVLIDKVALDEFWVPRGKWVNVGRVVAEDGVTESTSIVSSISKTRSLPGCRFGYLMGSRHVVDAVREITRTTIMNPPIQMVLPLCMDALLRAIKVFEYEGKPQLRRHAITLFRRLFLVSNAMADQRGDLFQALFSPDSVEREYKEFSAELNANFDQIEANHRTALKVLEPHLEATSRLQSGFNMAMRFTPFAKADQLDVCRQAFEAKGLALFPERCFSSSPTDPHNFWVRLSLAAPPLTFGEQIHLLREHLDAIF